MVTAEDLIKFSESARLAVRCGSIEHLLLVQEKLRKVGRSSEIKLPILVDVLGRSEPEHLVANDGPSEGRVIVPAKKIRDRVRSRNIGTVERAVAVIDRSQAMEVIAAGFGYDVDHSTRGVAELGFVARGDDLKLRDGILIEL